jgi:hypothetical protein
MRLRHLAPLSLASLCLSGCIIYNGDSKSDGPDRPATPDAGQASSQADAGPELVACSVIDQELSLNCDIDEPCTDFTSEEHACVSELVGLDFGFRPPCEEYAVCLDIPLFSCAITDQELSLNCGIERECSTMTWGERFCLSALMAVDWAQPPCEQYAECLDITLFSCTDIDAELSANCQINAPCGSMSFQERLCVSDLMNQEWAAPPCDLYQDCVQ